MNKIILIGCLVQNPKVVASEGKKTAAYFRVAVNRKYGQEGDQNADYFSCVTFGTKEEFLGKYFQKGKRIALEGEMHNDNYTNDRGSIATGRFNQRSSYQNSSYYQNSNQNKTNRTGNRTQNAQPSRQHSQDSYSVDEQFMNAGGEAMDDFC